jgi:hypothetical protein
LKNRQYLLKSKYFCLRTRSGQEVAQLRRHHRGALALFLHRAAARTGGCRCFLLPGVALALAALDGAATAF